MSFQVTTAFVQQYRNNVYFLAQQKGSRLRGSVRNETQKGQTEFFEQIGPTAAVKRTARHGDTPLVSTPHSRRSVTLDDYEWADLVDNQDKLRLLIDPTSAYAQNAANALARGIDDEIISAAIGTAYTGQTGTTQVALPNSQIIVPTDGTNVTGFSIEALLAIKKKFDDADIDEDEERFICYSSQQLQDLLNTVQVQNIQYNTVRALAEGKIDTFMGFKFIRSQRLPLVSLSSLTASTGVVGAGANTITNGRGVIAWAKSGLLLSVAEDIMGEITPRPDKSYSMQVYARMSVGASRMEEVKVVQCVCKEPGVSTTT